LESIRIISIEMHPEQGITLEGIKITIKLYIIIFA